MAKWKGSRAWSLAACVAVLLLIVPACLSPPAGADTRAVASWTVMVYMAGDNNLEKYGIMDINEMEYVGSNAEVNIVAQFDRADGYDTTNGDWKGTRRFLVQNDQDPDDLYPYTEGVNTWNIGEQDMSNPATLVSFANWTFQNYPAEHYALILWDHGEGWKGALKDTQGIMDMGELRWALSEIADDNGGPLDIGAFDACNMGMLEVFAQFSGYCDYAVASEKEEDAHGWPYDEILFNLTADPGMDGRRFATAMVEEFIVWSELYSTYSATMAAVDVGRMDDLLESTNELAWRLLNSSALYGSEIDDAREATEQYPKPPIPYDLYDLAEQLQAHVPSPGIWSAAEALKAELEAALVAEASFNNSYAADQVPAERAHGIGISMPSSGSEFGYGGLVFSNLTAWDEFLDEFALNKPRPMVSLETTHLSKDLNGDGIADTIEYGYLVNQTGLTALLEVFDSGHERVAHQFIGSTEAHWCYATFNPLELGLPSDLYTVSVSVLDQNMMLQNESLIPDVWLGDARTDLLLSSVEVYRRDGCELLNDDRFGPIAGEDLDVYIEVSAVDTITPIQVSVLLVEDGFALWEENVTLDPDTSVFLETNWTPSEGAHVFSVQAIPAAPLREMDKENNVLERTLIAKSSTPMLNYWVNGSVVDAFGDGLGGATIRLTNQRTGHTAELTTSDGEYALELPAIWYMEGDEVVVSAIFGDEQHNETILMYSDVGSSFVEFKLDYAGPPGPGPVTLIFYMIAALAVGLAAVFVVYFIRMRKEDKAVDGPAETESVVEPDTPPDVPKPKD